MITSLLEFYFSKHYFYDEDNRFKLRVKDIKIHNDLPNMEQAVVRFRQAMSYLALERLDTLSTTLDGVAVILGAIFFRYTVDMQSKIVPANLEADKNSGNVYVAIVGMDRVVTILLLPSYLTNGDILEKVTKESKNVKIDRVINLDGAALPLESKSRPAIIIDLDVEFSDFARMFPTPKLKNNPWSDKAFSKIELEDILRNNKERERLDAPAILSPSAIPANLKPLIPEKEFVIYEGMKIWVKYPDGVKEKVIKKLIVNATGDSKKFSLMFENTAKTMELEIGSQFVITPVMANDVYQKLIDGFNLDSGEGLSFLGPITKFNFYKKGKGGSDRDKLGVIISPRLWLSTGSKSS